MIKKEKEKEKEKVTNSNSPTTTTIIIISKTTLLLKHYCSNSRHPNWEDSIETKRFCLMDKAALDVKLRLFRILKNVSLKLKFYI